MRLCLDLDSPDAQDVARVGGKAASLAGSRAAGLPVPGGRALTVDFFAPWLDTLKAHEAFPGLADAGRRAASCRALQQAALGLPLSERQQAVLDGLDGGPWAVRSSSPEEDLEGSSFAGGYHTELGVRPEGLADAVRAAFASALDLRVLTYKEQHGLDPLDPRIAVVVQRQLDARVAGVAFSVDPATNDYDLCAIDAAPGLGESVVSGAVTPDHFVVDTHVGAVVERVDGQWDHQLVLADDGAPARQSLTRAGPCLRDEEVSAVAALAAEAARVAGGPVDIEWAYVDDELHLLQSRPITAWVPLDPSMVTAPGERRRLYQDLGLSGGLTINAPISPIGESWMERFAQLLLGTYAGELPWTLSDDDNLWFLRGGRMYQDLSNALWVSTPWMLGRSQESIDLLVGRTLGGIDARRYRAPRRPRWLSPWWLFAYPRALWRLRRMLWRALSSALWPESTRERFDADVEDFRRRMCGLIEGAEAQTIDELVDAHGEHVIRHVLEVGMPGLLMALLGTNVITWLLPARLGAEAEALSRGFPGNDVVEMGLALHALGPAMGARSPEQAAAELVAGTAGPELTEAWSAFVGRYGWRGPHEMDLASPRYADDPSIALRQVARQPGFDPAAAAATARQERAAAFETVLQQLGPLRRWLVRRAFRWGEAFGGTRDSPKHQYLQFFLALRRSLLREGAQLTDAGRLDHAEQITGLRWDEVLAARGDAMLDLRAAVARNTVFVDKLAKVVRAFPAVIDSRGRILRPPPQEEQPGELRGMPVSPGVVRGRVRVLDRPEDGPLEPGEILVAHTTDPGWTPLFVHAAAVVLEVGGVLQHGAVVAREYGKPCVSGIERAVERLVDGDLVEVDGSEGVVRRVMTHAVTGNPGQEE